MNGKLILVGTPIGDPGDVSSRALQTLREADLIACEEAPVARRFLSRHGIDKELIEVNEHTEESIAPEVLREVKEGKVVALISDCGMPVFADPGTRLVSLALKAGLEVDVVPGPDSLTTALAVSGFDAHRFLFYGFLSPNKNERREELSKLRQIDMPLVFLDAPYRLVHVLEDMRTAFGGGRKACVACDLTLPGQLVARGSLEKLWKRFAEEGKKREFVIIIGPREKTVRRESKEPIRRKRSGA